MALPLRGFQAAVTGASSGIGRALCVELARNGADLLVTARRAEALRALAVELNAEYGVTVNVLPGDITDEKTRTELVETVRLQCGRLDLLVHNAGVGATATLEATSEEAARRIWELNFFAPFLLTQKALSLLREAAKLPEKRACRPTVVFLSSIVGLRGTPHYGAYGAAKSAVANLADALRAEWAPDGIRVLTVSPGTTRTEFFDSLLENSSKPRFPKHRSVAPEVVARKIVRAILAGKPRLVPHFESRILLVLDRFFPRFVDYIMAKYR